MKMRLQAFLAILLAALMLVLAGCAGGDSAERETDVTLTIMGKKTDLEKSYMQTVFSLYKEATGNELKVISYEDSEFEDRASDDFAKGNTPDILLHFHNSDLARFSASENFLTLNDEQWVSDLTESARAYCQDANGNILGLPFWESSVSGCYYNKTLFDKLGLKAASNQAEFDMLCQVLHDIGITPVCWPGNGCTWMFQFGLDPIFADDPDLLEKINCGEITYGEIPAVGEMVGWLDEAYQKGWFGERALETGWSDIGPSLASGESAMTFIWDSWFYTDFTPGEYTVDDFALMPVFMNTADAGTYEGGNLNMMMVTKNSEKQNEALEFLRFCARPENYNKAFEGISTVSCFKGQTSNIESPMVTDAAQSIKENERVSTSASRVTGYSADDVASIFNRLFRGEISRQDCIRNMDESRIAEAHAQGAEGF